MKLLALVVETDLLFVIFRMFDANILVSGKVELILLLLPIELEPIDTIWGDSVPEVTAFDMFVNVVL